MLQMSDSKQFFVYKLGAALTMEETSVTMLRELSETANGSDLKEQLLHHRGETRGQIGNITQAFAALGLEPKPRPCPAIDALKTEAQMTIQLAMPELYDAAILAGCAAVEHYEIAVYGGLIVLADELHGDDVVALFKENLEQEQHALEEVETAFEQQTKALAERVTA
jgi:ferritin-like metal-binding protein YciE